MRLGEAGGKEKVERSEGRREKRRGEREGNERVKKRVGEREERRK